MPVRAHALAAPPSHGLNLLDAVVVILVSFGFALILLWMAGHLLGVNPFAAAPSDVKDFVNGAKGLVTGIGAAGAGVLLDALRGWSGSNAAHNFFLYIAATTICVLVLVLAVAYALRPISTIPLIPQLTLRFSVDPGSEKPFSDIRYCLNEPQSWCRNLHSPSGATWDEPVNITQGQRYLAYVNPLVQTAERFSSAQRDGMPICLVPSSKPPSGAKAFVELDCTYPQGCRPTKTDPRWMEICPADTKTWWLPGLLLGRALAADEAGGAGWRAPNLETLEAQREHGYTVFEVQLDAIPELAGADGISYLVTVNGTPVYFDGWSPARLKVRYDPGKPFELRFGLENLDFSGGADGLERIRLDITFWRGRDSVRQLASEHPYVALRDLREKRIVSDGVGVKWRATYRNERQDQRFEVFLLSTPDLKKAAAVKTRFDAHQVTIESRRAMAVLRPPLTSDSYGVTVGIVQPTGQIAFVFDEATANRVCSAMVELHGDKGASGLVAKTVFRYEIGARVFKECRKLQ